MMENDSLLRRIASELKLGAFTAQPQRVTGGYMHKMFQLETASGKYALKLLNPSIMKRPDAFRNYRRAERLERVLQENGIPVVPALEFNGQKMQRAGNQYFYVFPWVEGRALRWNEINEGHCRLAGSLLAKIHKLERTDQPSAGEEIHINWDAYSELAHTGCPELEEKLLEYGELFHSAQQQFNAALKTIPAATCICDGDMDSKNVLWVDGNPVVIDLECLDYGNPFPEMFQLALSWAGGVPCSVHYGRLTAFITAYRQECGRFDVDWDAWYGIGFGWLTWLEYNLKRALRIECENEEERKLGVTEALETIRRIAYYASIREDLLKHLSSVDVS